MEIKKTISTIFIVPTLQFEKGTLLDNGFINGYLGDVAREETYKDSVYILFKPKEKDKFNMFIEKEYESVRKLIDDYDYEGGWVVLVYKLDEKFKKDYSLVKKGKYSKTSKTFQELFPKVIKIIRNGLHKDEVALQHRIFKKAEDLKRFWEDKFDVEFEDEMEVWDGWNEENELLDITKFK